MDVCTSVYRVRLKSLLKLQFPFSRFKQSNHQFHQFERFLQTQNSSLLTPSPKKRKCDQIQPLNYDYLNEQMGLLKDENGDDENNQQSVEDVDTPNKLKVNTFPRTPTPFKNALHEFSKKRGET